VTPAQTPGSRSDNDLPPSPWWQILSFTVIVVGTGVVLLGIGLRSASVQTQTAVETTVSASSARLAALTPSGSPKPPPDSTKTTTTRSGISDTVLVAFLGAGAVLILAGAFYPRVKNIGFAGNTIELRGPTPENFETAADIVSRQLAADPTLASLSPEKRAAAVYGIAFEMAAASAVTPTPLPAGVTGTEVKTAAEGSSTEYWDRRAKKALLRLK